MQHQWQRCAPMQAHQCVRGQWTCGRARPPAPRVRSTTRRLCKAAEGDDGPAAGPSIIVYSKQECPLCVGLEVRPCRRVAPGAALLQTLQTHLRAARPRPYLAPAQEKVQALIARAQFMPSALTGASLEVRTPHAHRQTATRPGVCRAVTLPTCTTCELCQVRDVSERAEWQAQYAGQVPVLVVLDPEGNEVSA